MTFSHICSHTRKDIHLIDDCTSAWQPPEFPLPVIQAAIQSSPSKMWMSTSDLLDSGI